MWTFRSFVWGLRFMMIGLLLAIPTFAFRWEPLVPWLVMLIGGGLLLGIPFRVWAYWKLDIPYTTLFAQAIHDAIPPQLRNRTVIRFQIRSPTAARIAHRISAAHQVERDPATSVEERLHATRKGWPYRASVWGYRIMLVSLLLFCGGNVLSGVPVGLVAWPVLTFLAGFFMTLPMQWVAQLKLRVPRGQVMLQVLRDTFNLHIY